MEQSISRHLTDYFNTDYIKLKPVSGGDINLSFKVEIENKNKKENEVESYFVKANKSKFAYQMFQTESKGLEQLKQGTTKVPKVLLIESLVDEGSILLMEHLSETVAIEKHWEELAIHLAQIHRTSETYFGNQYDNFIGTLPQVNNPTSDWAKFYAERRILPLTRKCYDNGIFSSSLISQIEKLCARLPLLFPKENPSLLHGDFWGGNKLATSKGFYFVDPSVYYGHREMDIAMSLLFGGFNQPFYEHYNDCFPLEKNWQERVALCQLYPLLVHLTLFGESYLGSVQNVAEKYS